MFVYIIKLKIESQISQNLLFSNSDTRQAYGKKNIRNMETFQAFGPRMLELARARDWNPNSGYQADGGMLSGRLGF